MTYTFALINSSNKFYELYLTIYFASWPGCLYVFFDIMTKVDTFAKNLVILSLKKDKLLVIAL